MHAHLLNNVLVFMKREDYDITGRALSKPGSLLHPCSQKHKRKPIQTQNKHCAALDLCSGEQRTCGNLRYDLQQGCALLRNNLSPYGADHPNLYGLYQKFSASISTALDYSFTITSGSFYCVTRELTHISFSNKVLFSSLIIFIRSHICRPLSYEMRIASEHVSTCPSSTWCPHMRMK